MKRIPLIFWILLCIGLLFFLVPKNNPSQNSLIDQSSKTWTLWSCIFEVYENKDILWNFNKQVGHATLLKNGLFLTNKHIIDDLQNTYLLSGNWISFAIGKIWFESWLDLAYLDWDKQIDCNLQIKEDNEALLLWQEVFTRVYRNWKEIKKIGNIIWLNKTIKINGENYQNLILSNLKLMYWDSWSPLFDINWNIIWINTAISQENNTTYSLLLDDLL